MRDVDDLSDLETLTLTIWGEARSESILGRGAVAMVIKNRVDARTWYGNGFKEVCLKGWQFSAWNTNDPNRALMLNVSASDRKFIECGAIAELCMADALRDVTNGATHYHTAAVTPSWSKHKSPSRIIGRHQFYNNID